MTKIINEPIPIRPSNQSGCRVDKHHNTFYAVGGGVCTYDHTASGAVEKWKRLLDENRARPMLREKRK